MSSFIGPVVVFAILLLAIRESYLAWFQTEIFLEKTRRRYDKFPSFRRNAFIEKATLWQVRIFLPIASIFLIILSIISFITRIEQLF